MTTRSTTSTDTDVCILGAGMAGLTLARQLHKRCPDLDITLLEHRRFPVPEATHKVGESTVEIAAHYLSEQLDLREHLGDAHLPKFGLRMFMGGAAPARDLASYDEIGVSRVLPIPTYQVDRGRLENHLADTARAQGMRVQDGTTIRALTLAPGAHRVQYRTEDKESQLTARYLVDSSGRRSWLRQQQGLARQVRHGNHAVWFRVAGELQLDDWGQDKDWQQRCAGTARRFSTNHFTGPGYWVWLIPLASGTTSVGLVFDPAYVDLEQVNQHPRLLAWLAGEHPLLAAQLAEASPLDFHVLKDYAKGCTQNFSADGWMLSGDAGMFADPFYSPGADFIAFSNGFITELIANECDAETARKYQAYLQAFFSNTLSLYRGQYGGFGDADMMVLKTIWDYAYYWGPLAKLYFSGRFTDTEFMDSAQATLVRGAALNSGMQKRFRELAQQGLRRGGRGRFFDHHHIPMFHRIKAELEQGDHPGVASQLQASVNSLEGLSTCLQGYVEQIGAGGELPDLETMGQGAAFA